MKKVSISYGLLALALSAGLLGGCDKLGGGDSSAQQPGPSVPAQNPSKNVAAVTPVAMPGEVLATVNGVQITKADLELRIRELKAMVANAGQEWQTLSREQLSQLLDEVIEGELLRQEVLESEISKQTDVQRRWIAIQRQLFSQEWINAMQQQISIDSAAIEQFYQQNQAGFREPERLSLRQIVVATEDQAKNALAMLYAGTAKFDLLARQVSVGPNKSEGGLLERQVIRGNELAARYQTAAEAEAAGVMSLDPALETAAFAIGRPGGFSNYVQGPDGNYYIFELVERAEGKQQALNEVWDNIKTFLTLQKLQERMNSIKADATIERFNDRLEGVAQ